jgi:hypothetical protein
MIFLAGCLVLCTSVFITSIIRVPNKPAYLLSIYILSFAHIVLVGQIANSFLVLNRPWAFIFAHAILCIISIVIWLRNNKPLLLGPFINWREEISAHKPRVELDLVILGLAIAATFLFAVVLIMVVPPNNNDGLSTYFSRVGYWLQNGSFFPWATNRIYQISYPINAQLQSLWVLLFWRSDYLLGFIQWIAGLVAMIAVFGLGRLLGWDRSQSAFAALLFASFPQVVLQISSSQTDLLTAAIFSITIYFFLLGLQTNQRGMLLLSGVGLGLAFGTKQTLYYLAPGLGLFILLAWIKFGSKVSKNIVYWVIASLVSFILFAAYMNVINLVNFNNPFGPPDIVAEQIVAQGKDEKGFDQVINNLLYNVPRSLYQAIDVASLPRPIDGYAFKLKAKMAHLFFDAINFPIEGQNFTAPKHTFDLDNSHLLQEDQSWYGPISFLLLFPIMIWQFIQGLRTKEWIRIGLILNPIILLVVLSILRPGWDESQGRYYLPVVTIVAPLLASIFQEKTWSRVIRYAAVCLAIVVVTVSLLCNPAKPVAGKRATQVNIWTADRPTLQSLQGHSSRAMFYMVNEYVPLDTTLGVYTPGYILDFPLFGEHLTRRLVPIYPLKNISNKQWLKDQQVEYILIQRLGKEPKLAEGLKAVDWVPGWVLYTWDQ